MRGRRGRYAALVLLLAAGLGLAGHAMGRSSRPAGSSDSERESAYAKALTAGLRDGFKRGHQRGYSQGLQQGEQAGRFAGTQAGAAKGFSQQLQTAAAPAPAASVIWAVGDSADGGKHEQQVTNMIGQGIVDRLLYLGDVYESGTATEFASHYDPFYGGFDPITAPTPGNHDWPNHVKGYDAYWQTVKGRPQPPWYTFTAGGWQLISLNSETAHDSGSPQLDFLNRTIASTPKFGTCRLAFWHRPRYSAGTEHGDQSDVQPFWDALNGHAALVVNGHEHDMQRFDPVGGITELVAGAGGHDLYKLHGHSGLAFGDDTDYGALRLKLASGQAQYAFVATDGHVLDSGKTSCHKG